MRCAWLGCAALALALLGACRLGAPATEPLRGATPASVVVWPELDERFAEARELLLDDLGAALAARGYHVIPFRVARASFDALAAAAGADGGGGEPAAGAPPTPGGLAHSLAADAVLQLVVRDFAAAGTRPLQDARWDLEWRLVSPVGGIVWSWTSRGSWQPATGPAGDPHRALDDDLPVLVPIGGDARVTFRDAGELVAWLHRDAMARLPHGPR